MTRSSEAGAGDSPSDEALAAAARAGDERALETLLRRHHPRVYALCHRLTGGHDADDACQESLLAIARGVSSFGGRSSFSTWAYRVTTNACFDELRRRRRFPLLADPEAERSATDAPGGGRASPGADDVADDVDARTDVDAALASLPPEFRAAVVLRDLCDLSYGEIADVLGVPVGTVRSRIARGRAALVPLLAPEDHGPAGNPAPSPERPSS